MDNTGPDASEVLQDLLEGNRRFREGLPRRYEYRSEELLRIAEGQSPRAAVVACSDSRVVPEVLFDQPLGSLFVSRVPGNVASDGSRWMIEIAMTHFRIPLVVVLGHTGCLAVKSVVEGIVGVEGGPLRLRVMAAVERSRAREDDPVRRAVEENARLSIRQLSEESAILRRSIAEGATTCVPMLYEMESGTVIRL